MDSDWAFQLIIDLPDNKASVKNALQRKKRRLVDDQDARNLAKRQSSREQSIHQATEREAREALWGNASQHETALCANSELPREAPTVGDGGDDSETAPQNRPSGTTKPAEAAGYSHHPSAFQSQGRQIIPGDICASKYPAPEHGPYLRGTADRFDIESIMIPGFDRTFTPNTTETETAPFDIARVMSPSFDMFAGELPGRFNVEALDNPVTRVHAQAVQDTPSCCR